MRLSKIIIIMSTFFVSSIAEQTEPIDDPALEVDIEIDCEDDSEDDEGS